MLLQIRFYPFFIPLFETKNKNEVLSKLVV